MTSRSAVVARRLIAAGGDLAGFPRLLAVGAERAHAERYRHGVARRVGMYATVQLTLRGHGRAWQPGAPAAGIAIPADHALLFVVGEPGVAYGFPPGGEEPWDFLYAEIGGDAAIAMARELLARRGRVLPLQRTHRAVRALQRLLRGGGERTLELRDAIAARLATDLLLALGESGPSSAEDGLPARAMAWLGARLGEPVGIAEAAATLGVSREHLTRAFARRRGEPPGRWLRRERLALAERLLREDRAPVEAVARRSGFADPTHFARAFAARYGVAPTAYRRQLGR